MRWAARWRERRTRLLQLWGVGVAVALLVTGASARGDLEGLQAYALDILMTFQGRRILSVSDVVIVAIDDAAFERIGRVQPIPRDYLAKVIRGAERAGASVVGLDVALASPTKAAADGALARALLDWSDGGRSRVVVLDSLAPEGPLGLRAMREAVTLGAAEVPEDPDGVIRRVKPIVPRRAGPGTPTLGLAVVVRLTGTVPTEALGQPGDGLLRINYVGPADTFISIPSDAVAALVDPGAELAADNALRGRVVLIGGTFKESGDFRRTPYGRSRS